MPAVDDGSYTFADGISYSTPILGGLAAFIRGLRGAVAPAQVKATIQQLSRELEVNSPDILYDAEHPQDDRVAFA